MTSFPSLKFIKFYETNLNFMISVVAGIALDRNSKTNETNKNELLSNN